MSGGEAPTSNGPLASSGSITRRKLRERALALLVSEEDVSNAVDRAGLPRLDPEKLGELILQVQVAATVRGTYLKGNAELRDGLTKLVARASNLIRDLDELPLEAVRAIRDSQIQPPRTLSRLLGAVGTSEEKQLQKSIDRLRWLSGALLDGARHMSDKPQKAKWRSSERRKRSIRFCARLITPYETAFGKKATLNNWVGARPGPFHDFCKEMFRITPGGIPLDLRTVVREAIRRKRAGGGA